MQEKLIDILSRATAWMTAPQIADAGGWRSASNVAVALQQMEKANGQVERRKSPTETMGNGLPATEWKLTDKKIKDATESKMGRKPKHPPLEPAASTIEKRAVEIAVDRHNKSVDLAEKLADVQRQLEISEAANDSWLRLASEFECKSIPDMRILVNSLYRRIDDLKAESSAEFSVIEEQRNQIAKLNEQLMHGTETVDVKNAKGYLVCAPKRKPAKLMKADSAVERAKAAAKATGRSELFALVQVGLATRKRMNVIVFQELAA